MSSFFITTVTISIPFFRISPFARLQGTLKLSLAKSSPRAGDPVFFLTLLILQSYVSSYACWEKSHMWSLLSNECTRRDVRQVKLWRVDWYQHDFSFFKFFQKLLFNKAHKLTIFQWNLPSLMECFPEHFFVSVQCTEVSLRRLHK